MAVNKPASLRLVQPTEELIGAAPKALERAARLCRPGDAVHRGLVRLTTTLASHGLKRTLPPRASTPGFEALEAAWSWARGTLDDAAVRRARSDAFVAVAVAERLTVDAVRGSMEQAKPAQQTPLDPHADGVVLRHAGLAANHAFGAALLVLDGVDAADKLVLVPQQLAGALAYQWVGLGAARNPKLRALACEQAEWEAERVAANHERAGLALMVFHEYLGGLWKDYSDAQRSYFGDFIEWALAPLSN